METNMAERLPVSLVFGGDYDRIRPLRDGSIKPEGLELKVELVGLQLQELVLEAVLLPGTGEAVAGIG
jgi:hypothetical protein